VLFPNSHFEQAETQIEQILTLIGVQPEMVLDLACGPGRHVLPLAKQDFSVTGVDASAYLLGLLQAELNQFSIPPRVELFQADMRDFKRNAEFDLILCLWTSFGCFEHGADDQRVLENVCASLREGGRFLLDVVGKEYIVHNFEPISARELDHSDVLIEQHELLDYMSRMNSRWTLVSGDRIHRASFSLNIYSAVELQDRLFAAGFSSVQIFGDLEGREYDLDADRLILLAGK